MSAPLPDALRARFQRYIEEGLSGRAAALRLKLSPAAGARWALAIRRTGRAEAAPQGADREARASWTHIALCLPGSLPKMAASRCPSWVLSCLTRRGARAHPNAIGKFLRKLGYTYKKVTGRHRAPPCQGKAAARRRVQAPYSSRVEAPGTRCLYSLSLIAMQSTAGQWTKPL